MKVCRANINSYKRTVVFRLYFRLAVFRRKLLYAGCVTFCRRHTPVCAAVVVSLSIGGGGHGSDRATVAVAASCDPPEVATGPAGGCPPVCQRSEFPLGRNMEIIPDCAVGCKGAR